MRKETSTALALLTKQQGTHLSHQEAMEQRAADERRANAERNDRDRNRREKREDARMKSKDDQITKVLEMQQKTIEMLAKERGSSQAQAIEKTEWEKLNVP